MPSRRRERPVAFSEIGGGWVGSVTSITSAPLELAVEAAHDHLRDDVRRRT